MADNEDIQPTLSRQERAQIEANTTAQITAAMNQFQATMQQQFQQLQQQLAGNGQQQQTPPHNPKNNQGPVYLGGPLGNNKEWNAEDIGYFDPDYDGEGPVVSFGKNVYYRDVYAFIERLKDMTPIRGMEKLRTVLPQCFRGSALIWHSTEVSERDKRLYRTAPLEEWYDILTTRFKERTPMALIKMQSARYTMTDAKNRKDPRAYVQDVARYAKAANLTSVPNQLAMAWNNLDWEFRLHIPEPTAETTLQQFLESLDAKSDMWFEMARHRGSSTTFRDRDRKPSFSEQDNQRRRDQRDLHTSTKFSNKNDPAISDLLNLIAGARANYPNYTKKSAYNDNQNRTFQSDVNPAHLQASSSGKSDSKRPYIKEKYVKEKFSKGTDSDKKDYKNKDKGKGKQHAYVAEEEDIPEDIDYYDPDHYYDEEDNDASHASSAEDASANHTTGDSDVSDSEIIIDDNMVTTAMITTSIPHSHRCRTCQSVFDSNNKLHKPIRAGCSAILHTNLKETPPILHASIKTLPAPALIASEEVSVMTTDVDVVHSTVDPNKDIGTDYGFRGYKYAQTDVSLWEETPNENDTTRKNTLTEILPETLLETPSKDPKQPAPTPSDSPPPNEKSCLDTGAGITIADNAFFKRQTKGKVSIRTMETPITVRGIGTNRHLTNKYAIGTISLFGKAKGKPTIARFWREIHLVDKLKANILLGTDILGPEKIAIDFGKREAFIGSCNVTVPTDIGSGSTASVKPHYRAVHIKKKTTIIPLHTVSPVIIHHLGNIPKDRDYLFEPDDVNFSLYVHLMDAKTSSILVRNDTHKSLKIPRNFRLGHVTELDYSNAYHVTREDTEEYILFTASLVEISDDFHQRFSDQYERDPLYIKVTELLKEGTEDGAPKFSFVGENGLIFRLGEADEPRRLCIPAALAKDIFDTAHDQNGHSGFARCYERVVASYYLRNLSGLLRDYLRQCPKCQVNQTRRHAPYGSLQPILSPPVPFHTITIDFILALPLTRDKLNCALSTTCKFSKRLTVIPGKNTWSAKDWALALLQRFNPADWPDILDDLQNTNNNSISASTTKTPNEIVYGFTPVRNTDLFIPTNEQPTLPIPVLVRREASDAIAFAQINAKIAYDRKHRPISMKEGDYALLRLHATRHTYILMSRTSSTPLYIFNAPPSFGLNSTMLWAVPAWVWESSQPAAPGRSHIRTRDRRKGSSKARRGWLRPFPNHQPLDR